MSRDHDDSRRKFIQEVGAGALVLGKTNTPEWGLLPVTEPELWGPCLNPWNTKRSPGGSSGGSAAAVAAGAITILQLLQNSAMGFAEGVPTGDQGDGLLRDDRGVARFGVVCVRTGYRRTGDARRRYRDLQ